MHSQENYVQNGSFEEVKFKIFYFSRIEDYKHWFTPNGGTADAFLQKDNGINLWSIPNNYGGFQEPYFGNYYAGFFVVKVYSHLYQREYISTKLSNALTADALYCVKMYLSLADAAKYSAHIDISLSENRYRSRNYSFINASKDNIVFGDTIITEKEAWVEETFIFKAKGGEQY